MTGPRQITTVHRDRGQTAGRRCLLLLLWLVLLAWPIHPLRAQPTSHNVYFENTDYELHVYRVNGKSPGKTLLLIGGIQGNEPGGFLSADLYVDLCLAKGNLIIVPRANFNSILLNRRHVNKDMNRTFSKSHRGGDYEENVVAILKKLIAQSDCFLNLHDGSGFYSSTWQSNMRNPKRYGQSIIADAETHYLKDSGRTINLGEMARSVITEINKHIKNPQHHFHFANHKTKQNTSLHKEQRRSATYYALYTCGIPAFGIETNKRLPLAEKVKQHNYAINAFMQRLDIIPETPGIYLDQPELRYLLISINDSLPTMVANNQTLYVNPGDRLRISHIEANYKRGLSADIIGLGTLNDMDKTFAIKESAKIKVKKDFFHCGTVYVRLGGNRGNLAQGISVIDGRHAPGAMFYKLDINGHSRILPNYGQAELVKGDTLKIIDVIQQQPPDGVLFDVQVNFKGFVGDRAKNTGEDRGFLINTGRDLWKRYSLKKQGRRYQTVITHGDDTLGKFFINLTPPKFKYVILETSRRGQLWPARPGQRLRLEVAPEETIQITDIISNVENNRQVVIDLYAGSTRTRRLTPGDSFCFAEVRGGNPGKSTAPDLRACRLVVKRHDMIMGEVYLESVLQEKING